MIDEFGQKDLRQAGVQSSETIATRSACFSKLQLDIRLRYPILIKAINPV